LEYDSKDECDLKKQLEGFKAVDELAKKEKKAVNKKVEMMKEVQKTTRND
jgi:hypothetical protein